MELSTFTCCTVTYTMTIPSCQINIFRGKAGNLDLILEHNNMELVPLENIKLNFLVKLSG